VRRFPDFLIVGAQKCGTSSLYYWLQASPDCYLPAIKEPHYFARFEPWKGLLKTGSVIRSRFEYQGLFAPAGPTQICGEASPSYLFEAGVAQRIRQTIPHCRIIVLVRDPVDRAYSEYLMNLVAGLEERTFLEAVTDAVFGRQRKSWADFPLYCEASKYGSQVERYLRVFPRSQVLVLTSHELGNQPKQMMRRVSEFLDVPGEFWNSFEFQRHNEGRAPRNALVASTLNSSFARRVGRGAVPQAWRQFVARIVLSGKPKKKRISMKSRELVWSVCEYDIRLLESLIGEHFPELWTTYPDST